MEQVITSFTEYRSQHKKATTAADLDLYRRLGHLDASHEYDGVRDAVEAALLLLEAWSLLRLEQPDLGLAQMGPAGKHMAGHQPEATAAAERLREMIVAHYPLSVAGAEALHAGMKGEDAASFRETPLWIGGGSREEARYVAPEAKDLAARMDELCTALEQKQTDPLHMLGVAHSFAFLLLPFAKDNARWVGIWTQTMARALGVPRQYLLPFGYGVLQHKDVYSSHLLGCALGETAAWQQTWQTITTDALAAGERVAKGVWELWRHTMAQEKVFGKTHKHLPALLLALAGNPYITLHDTCEVTGLTKPNAARFLKRCIKVKLLKQVTFDHRNRVYMAPTLVKLLGG